MMMNCLFVGLGGFIGSICRYLIGRIPLESKSVFPYKTLIINIAGSFLIGIIAAAATKNADLNPHLVLLFKVGICGGFTTFSTFALESLDLFNNGHTGLGLIYVIGSAVLSILAVFGGSAIIR